MIVLLCLFGSVFLLYFFYIAFFYEHGNSFYFIWLILGVLSFFSAVFLKVGYWDNVHEVVRIGIRIFLIIGGTVLLIALTCILSAFSAKGVAGLDYLVVLGAQMKVNGPSAALKYRLDAAHTYYKENPTTILVVSGGQGSNEPKSEAQGMFDYLVGLGVPGEQIIKENQSVNTVQNIIFSATYFNKEQARVGIVTSNFHVFRSLRIAKKAGYQNVCGIAAKGEPILQYNNLLRESLSVIKDFLVGNL